MHIVITGTSRGIGLEFVRQYLERGDHVDAGLRHPDAAHDLSALAGQAPGRLRIFSVDTTSEPSVQAFAAAVGDVPVDLLINNAGISGGWEGFFDTKLDDALRTFDTNALGSIRVMRAFLPHLRRSSIRKIVNISSSFASIAEATTGMLLGYRMSKVALNMATKVVSQELSGEKFSVLMVHPGWVKTDMGGKDAPTTAQESVQGMITEIDRRGPEDTGTFFDFTGKTIAW